LDVDLFGVCTSGVSAGAGASEIDPALAFSALVANIIAANTTILFTF
jgi:hypothetical protein